VCLYRVNTDIVYQGFFEHMLVLFISNELRSIPLLMGPGKTRTTSMGN
jgi:hypothetical protein